jgi:acyl-CoA thioesterase-2
MDRRLAELLRLLELEQIELNIFRGESRDIGSPQVYGGQVLGQALRAASRTVEADRQVHSLHAYFLRRGDFNAPIAYFVERSRDGGSFSSRRVTAIQHGEPIFNMAASFHGDEPGVEHAFAMPEVPPPESLPVVLGLNGIPESLLSERQRAFIRDRPFDVRMVPVDPATGRGCLWLKAVAPLPADESLHRVVLAYVSDFHLLGTSLMQHRSELAGKRLVIASIDHAMWFHRPVRVDEWLLYTTDSPSASGALGYTRGSFYTREGVLVASMAQEGLVRLLPGGPPATAATTPPGGAGRA